jgi:hypothetical protein
MQAVKPRPKRSIPEVDALPPAVREQLSAAALVASRVYTEALDNVEKGQIQTRVLLKSMQRTQIATLVLVAVFAVFVAAEAFVRGHQIDSLDRRVEHLEHPGASQ